MKAIGLSLLFTLLAQSTLAEESTGQLQVQADVSEVETKAEPIDKNWPKRFYRVEGSIALQRVNLVAENEFAMDFVLFELQGSKEFALGGNWSTSTNLALRFGEGTDSNQNFSISLNKSNLMGTRLVQTIGRRMHLGNVYFRPYLAGGLGAGKVKMDTRFGGQRFDYSTSYSEAAAMIGTELVSPNRMIFSIQFEHSRQFYNNKADSIGLGNASLRGYSNALKTSMGYLF